MSLLTDKTRDDWFQTELKLLYANRASDVEALVAEDIQDNVRWIIRDNFGVAVCEAQDKLSREGERIKTLKAVAEWGAETCTKDELHLTGGKLQERKRMDCPLCMANLWEAVSEGKMPGEE